jgi:hypothetical protein
MIGGVDLLGLNRQARTLDCRNAADHRPPSAGALEGDGHPSGTWRYSRSCRADEAVPLLQDLFLVCEVSLVILVEEFEEPLWRARLLAAY